MKVKMATKEQRSITVHDRFVNKLHNIRDQENNRSFATSGQRWNGFGMETQLKFIFEQIGSVPPTVDNFFFEWIALAIRTDNNFLKRISQAIQGDDNFSNIQPKPSKQMTIFFGTDRTSCSNGRQFFSNRQPKPFKWMKIFFERIPRAIQTDTKSVQKWQNIFQGQSAGNHAGAPNVNVPKISVQKTV